jgi:hypothetical protein
MYRFFVPTSKYVCERERVYIYIYIYLLIQILLLIHPSHTRGFARITPRYICIVHCAARDLGDTVPKKSLQLALSHGNYLRR